MAWSTMGIYQTVLRNQGRKPLWFITRCTDIVWFVKHYPVIKVVVNHWFNQTVCCHQRRKPLGFIKQSSVIKCAVNHCRLSKSTLWSEAYVTGIYQTVLCQQMRGKALCVYQTVLYYQRRGKPLWFIKQYFVIKGVEIFQTVYWNHRHDKQLAFIKQDSVIKGVINHLGFIKADIVIKDVVNHRDLSNSILSSKTW